MKASCTYLCKHAGEARIIHTIYLVADSKLPGCCSAADSAHQSREELGCQMVEAFGCCLAADRQSREELGCCSAADSVHQSREELGFPTADSAHQSRGVFGCYPAAEGAHHSVEMADLNHN